MGEELKKYSFEKLEVWKEARSLVGWVYKVSSNFPKQEIYGLTSQLRRAALSIPTNIAEGSGRGTSKDQVKFYQYAYSSALEVINLLYIATDLLYLDEEDAHQGLIKLNRVTSLLNRLVKAISKPPKPN